MSVWDTWILALNQVQALPETHWSAWFHLLVLRTSCGLFSWCLIGDINLLTQFCTWVMAEVRITDASWVFFACVKTTASSAYICTFTFWQASGRSFIKMVNNIGDPNWALWDNYRTLKVKQVVASSNVSFLSNLLQEEHWLVDN